jgi:predicted MPP superfamily phosphohydrolase
MSSKGPHLDAPSPQLPLFDRPSLLHTILSQPLHLLLRLICYLITLCRPQGRHQAPVRIVCISDTHSLDPGYIPDGDILIHAGDITDHGTPAELQAALDLYSALPHRHKFIIAGNHDTYLDPVSRETLCPADQQHISLDWGTLTCLQHSSEKIHLAVQNRTLHIYGAPQSPLPDPTFAFTYQPVEDVWQNTVPPETDILITHTPPKHHLDLPRALGCPHLAAEVQRVKPLLHVFGHVHAGRTDFEGRLRNGRERVIWDRVQAALQSGLDREPRGLSDLCDLGMWWDLGKVVVYGCQSVLQERVWGDNVVAGSTLMVNAALMFEGSGRLGNKVQVVDI